MPWALENEPAHSSSFSLQQYLEIISISENALSLLGRERLHCVFPRTWTQPCFISPRTMAASPACSWWRWRYGHELARCWQMCSGSLTAQLVLGDLGSGLKGQCGMHALESLLGPQWTLTVRGHELPEPGKKQSREGTVPWEAAGGTQLWLAWTRSRPTSPPQHLLFVRKPTRDPWHHGPLPVSPRSPTP